MKKIYAVSLSAILMIACGDETTTNVVEKPALQMVAAGQNMDPCTKENEGTMVFVSDSAAVYYCADGKWATLNGKNGENGKNGQNGANGAVGTSCSAKKVDKGIEVSCGGKVVGTLQDGVGANGKSTYELAKDAGFTGTEAEWLASLKGNDGKSCRATPNDEMTEITITCDTDEGEPVSYVVTNGKDGESGFCEIIDYKDGSFDVECGTGENATTVTLYKAFCGKDHYDPATQVCGEFGIFEICTEDMEGEMALSPEGSYYKCTDKTWVKATSIEVDTQGLECKTDATLMSGVSVPTNKYVCDNGKIRVATALEKQANLGCTSYNANAEKLIGYSYYLCKNSAWTYNFSHLNTSTVTYSGQSYKTVGIGNQMWFAQNLNYADSSTTPNLKKNSWCYANQSSNCKTYGRLYTWSAAMNLSSTYLTKFASEDGKVAAKHRGICPSGWHIPSHNDWQTLHDFVNAHNGSEGVGSSLKSGTWEKKDGVTITNKFGFNGIPAGQRNESGSFADVKLNLDMTSTSEVAASVVNFWRLRYDNNSFYERYYGTKSNARAVRCLKD